MTNGETLQLKEIKIWQQNINQSKTAQEELLANPEIKCYDILALQEPFFYSHIKLTKADPNWSVIYPPAYLHSEEHIRSVILVNKRLSDEAWANIDLSSPDVTGIQLKTDIGLIRIINLYVDQTNDKALTSLQLHLSKNKRGQYTRVERTRGGRQRVLDEQDDLDRLHCQGSLIEQMRDDIHYIWLGDFNCHHPLWDEERNRHLFTAANLDKAQTLLDLLTSHDMRMILPKDLPTLEAKNSKNTTRPDNTFASVSLIDRIMTCKTCPELRPPFTNHFPILTSIATRVDTVDINQKRNWRKTDWGEFHDDLEKKLAKLPPPHPIEMNEDLLLTVNQLEETIQSSITATVPMLKLSKKMKRWWNEDIATEKDNLRKLF